VTTTCQLLHSLKVGGAEVLAVRMARALGKTYRVVFACLDDLGTLGEQLRGEGFTVEVLGRKPGVDWSCSRRLRKFLRREGVALVQAHQYTPFFYALAARFPFWRTPILFTEHGRHQPDYPRRKRMLFNRLMLRRHDRVVGVGEAVRQALIHNEGFPAGRVGLVYNGIDLDAFEQPCPDRGELRRSLGLGASDLVLFQVARLDYLKDHATAVRTMERVVAHRPDARLVLVGEGPEQGKIEDLIRQKKLENNVLLFGLRKDVARLLPAADLFLLTSVSEGIPLTVIEAMAAQLPVVSTAVGGLAEVVEEGQTGLLAPAGDDAALAEKVLTLAGDTERRTRMGQNGRERARALFSEAKMNAEYLRLYEEMLRG
jgi:glycosyltransferase involved in cell wall biosynthesis